MRNKHIDEFMAHFRHEGLTFDDISLVTQYADLLPSDTKVNSFLSRNIKLNVPLVSAAMDTVTESAMAIAMARVGGIGVIHKNLSSRAQAGEVAKVKHYLNGFIKDPVVFHPDQTVQDILDRKRQKNYPFLGFPIVERDGKLVGMITARDIKFLVKYDIQIGEVMTRKLVAAPDGTPINEAFNLMVKHRVGKLPTVDDNGSLTGLYSFHDVKSLIENNDPDFNRDQQHRLRVAAAISPYDDERAEALARADVDAMVVDTAHGHSKGVVETVAKMKKLYPHIDVIAGNIATGEAAKALLDAGADAVKVGIGPGSICTTRVVAGVGVPQISAIHEVSKAIGGEVPIIADGGIKQSGDIAKALAVGAFSVMMGSSLAGTEESPGEKILHQGRMYVVYRGMGSVEAMRKGKGSRERYGQKDVDDPEKLVPQGIEGLVLFRGPVANVIHQYVGGLRYSLGYCGAETITELQSKARLVRVTGAGLREAHPHDIKITKDAPNYVAE